MDLVHIRGALAKGADVAKWIKAMDCGSITRGFNPRRSPIRVIQYHRGMIGAPPTSRHPISEAIAPGLPEVQVLFAFTKHARMPFPSLPGGMAERLKALVC